MSQSELAGSPMTLAGELPSKGRRFPDLELAMASGRRIRLSDYRGRSNLVLLFIDDRKASAELLLELARSYDQLKSEDGDVIAIAHCPKDECSRIEERLKLPFTVLADEDGRIHREVGASDPRGRAATAVYLTDRYGEVFEAYRTRDGEALPGVAEILSWLEFIKIQCPECEPPEWPA